MYIGQCEKILNDQNKEINDLKHKLVELKLLLGKKYDRKRSFHFVKKLKINQSKDLVKENYLLSALINKDS